MGQAQEAQAAGRRHSAREVGSRTEGGGQVVAEVCEGLEAHGEADEAVDDPHRAAGGRVVVRDFDQAVRVTDVLKIAGDFVQEFISPAVVMADAGRNALW